MTIAYVQNTLSENQPPTTPMVTAAFSSPNSAGNSIIVTAYIDSVGVNDFPSNPFDTQGNTYVSIVTPREMGGGFGGLIAMYWCAKCIGGSGNQVKIAFTGASHFNGYITAVEYSGGLDTLDVGKANASDGVASTLATTGNFVTTQTGIIVATASSQISGPGTNYTGRLNSTLYNIELEDWIGAPPGTNVATAPLPSGQWTIVAGNFYNSGLLPPSPVINPRVPAIGRVQAIGRKRS